MRCRPVSACCKYNEKVREVLLPMPLKGNLINREHEKSVAR
jgi:hypothetical protein